MRKSIKLASFVLTGVALAAAAGVLATAEGREARAQTPPAPCACSRATSVAAGDEGGPLAGQFQARFGVVHCQCGPATCVSQIPYGSGGVHQLACVK